MQDAAQFVQLAQTLCYDLARAEKATDGKKKWQKRVISVLVNPCPICATLVQIACKHYEQSPVLTYAGEWRL